MSKDFLYKSQVSKTHFFDDMKRCKCTIKYIKNYWQNQKYRL